MRQPIPALPMQAQLTVLWSTLTPRRLELWRSRSCPLQAREVLLNEDKRRAYDAEVRAAASGAYAADGDGAGAPLRRTSSAGTASRSPEEEFRV